MRLDEILTLNKIPMEINGSFVRAAALPLLIRA